MFDFDEPRDLKTIQTLQCYLEPKTIKYTVPIAFISAGKVKCLVEFVAFKKEQVRHYSLI